MILKAYEINKINDIKKKYFLFYGENEGFKNQVIKEKFGKKTRIKIFGQKKNFLQRFGVNLINEAGIYLEERAAFARFGL